MRAAIREHPAHRILLVEDDDIMRLSLEDRLAMERIDTVSAADLAGARQALATAGPDLVITDIRLPDGSGRELFEEVRREHPGVPVIVITAYGSIPDAVALTKAGAVDYIIKPFDIDLFMDLVQRTISELEHTRHAELMTKDGGVFRAGDGVLGKSPSMRRIEELVARLRHADSSVLITGESGAGKEVIARLIHQNSRRSGGPFVAVNCAAIPLNLVESELFGHERGAFTGAERRHAGRFEQAKGGTIFLDEVAEIPVEIQVKLLRVLQERRVERVGGAESIPLDVRVLAATQVDLGRAMQENRFRPDLYWRLNVINMAIPPLRERREDIPYLAHLFVREHAQAMDKAVSGISGAAMARLTEMAFPGNARELRNLLERAVALCAGTEVQEHDLYLMEEDAFDDEEPPQLREVVEDAERSAIAAALMRNDWIIHKAAEDLGISRKSLWEKMKRYAIAR